MTHLMQLRFTEEQMLDMLSANGYNIYRNSKQKVRHIDPSSNEESIEIRTVHQLMLNDKNIVPTDTSCFISWKNCVIEEFSKVLHKKLLTI